MSEATNLILTIALCLAIMIGWRVVEDKFSKVQKHPIKSDVPIEKDTELSEQYHYQSKEEILNNTSNMRIKISNNKLAGSLLLKGAKFDDLLLKDYYLTTDKNSGNITLLSPTDTDTAHFIEFGWLEPSNTLKIPNQNTYWVVDKSSLLANDEIALTWNNQEGLVFKIKMQLDDNYMFKIEQEVQNNTKHEVKLIPYGRINRSHDLTSSPWISHEGAIGVINEQLQEWTYKKLVSKDNIKITQDKDKFLSKNWIGFADKYWVTALIPDNSQNSRLAFHAKYTDDHNKSLRFQVDFTKYYQIVSPNSSSSTVNYFFAGAKKLKLLDKYADKLNISLFDKAVDFGVLYFITKPVFILLEYFYNITKNFGLSILLLTIFMRIITLPLSNKAYISTFKIKKIHPEILRIKQLYKNDKLKMSKELSLLFKKHNTNPLSGIIPMIIQIPLFFTLYKVLFVTIEMRHSPFYLWIKDLSVPDPTNILTLFGLLKFNPSVCIGVLPIILGITIMIQYKLNPNNQTMQKDQIHTTLLKIMPYVMIFIFASFPTGLVIYWICNNVITIIQQLLIKYLVFKKLEFSIKNPSDEIV